MNCTKCGKINLPEFNFEQYEYKECGLSKVFLENVTVGICKSCLLQMPKLKRINEIKFLILNTLFQKPSIFNGEEIIFIRDWLSLDQESFAMALGVSNLLIKDWENNTIRIPLEIDHKIRQAMASQLVETYSEYLKKNLPFNPSVQAQSLKIEIDPVNLSIKNIELTSL